jgi:hypothetical protein
MAVSYQLVIDCASPEPLAHFWAEALHYVIAPPPPGFDSRIWFQIVPEKKSIKNHIHIDVNASGGRGSPLETRHERSDPPLRDRVPRRRPDRGRRRVDVDSGVVLGVLVDSGGHRSPAGLCQAV